MGKGCPFGVMKCSGAKWRLHSIATVLKVTNGKFYVVGFLPQY